MHDIRLALYLGLIPSEDAEEAFLIELTMTEMPDGGLPVVGSRYQFDPSSTEEPMEFEIDHCEDPDENGVIRATGHRWITYSSTWHHWIAILQALYPTINVMSTHTDMVNPDERKQRLQLHGD